MNGINRGLGRLTQETVRHWDTIIASMPIAPRVFGGVVPDASPDIARFHHRVFMDQRQRGCCVGFNLASTLMTRLRIPSGATPISEPLPAIVLSPLYQYDLARWGCRREGINIPASQDGAIGSVAIRAAHERGCCPWELEPADAAAVDRHPNDAEPPRAASEAGLLHVVKEFALADSFQHGLELLAVGFPLAFCSDIPEGMMHTDDKGFFRMKGSIVGGHCFAALAYNKKENWATIAQSWSHWGERRSGDPAYAASEGYTQIGWCPLDELESFFSASAMSSGRSEIICPNIVAGFEAPILVFDF